ncbi:DUF7940 domain-containing protein [Pseudomonas nicosulfuronedens]
MKPIDNWRCCHKLWSVRLSLLLALLSFAQLTLLPMWEAQLSPRAFATCSSVLATLVFMARLIRQDLPEQGEQQ